MSVELLLEIGTEEIPAGYLYGAAEELKSLAEKGFRDNRIGTGGEISVYYTPRRIAMVCADLAERQEDYTQDVMGPPRKAAFDGEGNPTKAATGFAVKNGVSVQDITFIETPRGEYLFVKRMIPGRQTIDVLSEILPEMISRISWPKSMRWADIGFPFVRPVHWVLALLGGKVIPFEIAGVKSGNTTMGHRFMSPRTITIRDFQDYLKKMKENYVVVNQIDRMQGVEKGVNEMVKKVSGVPINDPELTATVANLVEYPTAVCGSFDRAFLELPPPVLITAMRKHQKYFAVEDQKGQLMPYFVAINNTLARDEAVVTRGHERVLRARLSDAAFFFREDRKRPLADRLDTLKDVIYQARLGTSYAKVERFAALARLIAQEVAPEKEEYAVLAARLCKCDLVTSMVSEFPELQGVMGREYATLDGQPEEVCEAIREHYLPAKAGDDLPGTVTGAIVGMADRIDTISGFFTIGLEPTGAADPFALRRHALAIIRVIEDRGWSISLNELISKSLDLLERDINFDREKAHGGILNFFRDRYKNRMLTAGYDTDLVESIVSAGFDRISELALRMDHLRRFIRESGDFNALALTFKRVSNILKNQEMILKVDETIFKDPTESGLWTAFKGVKDNVRGLLDEKRYFDALNIIAGLKKPVDAYFDGVEVLTKDESLRNNRVAILQNVAGLFLGLADFSKFSI
ncbi:MAG: glycine--tRNA ligase subunit beta [Deltaproteobacteria bacterium]|nr:glycine--tRNA ligase subunit beta [Deltaproteobacteria bacterium]